MASLRSLFCALLLVAPTLASAQAAVRLRADANDPSAMQASVDTPTRLQVVVESGDNPVGGREVRWQIKGDDAILSKDKGLSSTGGGDQPPVGTASTLFTAHRGGSYTVRASTLVDAACTGKDCAWSTVEFHLDVPGGAAGSSEGSGNTWTKAAIVGAAAVALYSASDNSGLPAVPTLALVSGNNQSVIANAAAPNPLVVHAADDGNDAPGVSILWTVSGGATISSASTTTDSSGNTQVTVTNVGPGPGTITITAKRSDGAANVTFTLTVLTRILAKVSGDNQSAPVNTTVPQPLVVEARVNSTVQSGIGINWAVVSGDATIGSTTGATNGAGQASATIDLGPTPGPVIVSATRADDPTKTVSFTINSLLIRTLTTVSGDNQTGAPNAALAAPLVVNAQDNGANASGVTINWSATGGATLSSPTSVTDGAGNAQVTVTSTGPGPAPFTVTGTRADDPTATVTFNENILPPNLSIVAGDAQSGLTGSAAATALDVLLVDGASAPVAGQTITWTVTSGSAVLTSGSSVTDGAGHATMTFTYGGTPGPITIQASAYSGSQSVTFNETAVTASGVNKTSGDGQAANPGQVLAPFVITIVPPAGVTDLSGVPVTFTVTSGTATLSVTSTVTDAAGQASTTATLGLTPGTVTVVAQVTNGPSATFTATINGSLVGTILQIVSGDGQTLDVGVPSANMVVELRDAGALPGMTLTWSTNNGTVTPTSSITDASGRATATVTPATAGPVIVTVNFAAVAQYTASSIAFQHNTTLGSIPSLTTDQAAVAVALDNACADLSGGTSTPEEADLLAQCEALQASNPAQVADAIDEMLPDVAQTQTQTGQEATDAQFTNLNARMTNLRAGVSGPSFNGVTLTTPTGTISLGALASAMLSDEDKPKTEAGAGFSRWGFFASGNIGRGNTDANANAPAYDFDIKGLTAGVDYRVSDTLVVGGALGYTRQSSTLDGNQGSLKMDGWSVSGYATWYREKDWYLDGVLSLASNDYTHRRRVSYVLAGDTVDQVARASSSGTDISGSFTVGRNFHHQEWNFDVYGRAEAGHQNFDSYDEDLDAALAGSGLALHIEDRDVKALSSILGGKATWVHSTDWGVVMPMFGLEWQKEYQGDPDTFRAFLISDPTGTPILITGDALDDSYFRLNLGVSAVWTKGRSGFIQYDRIFGRAGNEQETLTLGGRIEF